MTSALERLAERIRTLRNLLGMSQEMLAEKTGLSLSLIRRVERKAANPTLTNLEKLAGVLGEDIADLFYSPTMQDKNKLRKHLILTDLSQLSVNQLLLIQKLIKSFQKEVQDDYSNATLGKSAPKKQQNDNQSIFNQNEEGYEYIDTSLGKIRLKKERQDKSPISAQEKEGYDYLTAALANLPLKRNLKDNS